MSLEPAARLKLIKSELLAKYSASCGIKASVQVVSTLLPYFAIWYVAIISAQTSYFLTGCCVLLLALFSLRILVLMHDAGHNSFFCSHRLNKASGFVLGVLAGMPQYVWSQHHNFHHSTNGDWSKYRGPLSTLSTEEFSELNTHQQKSYVRARRLINAPLGGFVYLILNPRLNWLKGCVALLAHIFKSKWRASTQPLNEIISSFETKHWCSRAEFWHMTANNSVLLSIWLLMSLWIGPLTFFFIYVVSLSLAGAGGIILFTVQHNFEHSYASEEEDWDYHEAALHGTSYLKLPAWLNWFTANIGYHHVHHLSARIPNYQLKQCHEEYREYFTDVPRLFLSQLPASLQCILWDKGKRRIISIDEYYQSLSSGVA